MTEENQNNVQNREVGISRSGKFLKESSVLDLRGGISKISLKQLTSGIDGKLSSELYKREKIQQRHAKQQEFLLSLIPEIFHDVRSPFISIIGFAGIFKQKTHSDKEISEYSEEILEESHSALKRLQALEYFFKLFLEVDAKKLEKLDIFETIEWAFTLLHVKISRKKLKIVKKIDKNLKSIEFLTYAGNVKMLLFELLCRLIVDSGNKSTLNLEVVGENDKITVSMLVDSCENNAKIEIPANFLPAFESNAVLTEVVQGQGYISVIRQETAK